ncbi:MAG: adenosylcobinamide-GDP ribazoletransferase [Firmicutes bacterium]|nr:adenosylcobinamide-GDP ribazoletransferase [Bacillota bacterium]
MNWITAFFMAWGMFLSVPCPHPRWDEKLRDRMLIMLPFVGLLIGACWSGLALALAKSGCPRLIGAAAICVFPHLMSGFIHLDGYMDCSDAILSRRDMETRKKILKDPHVGSFAVISVCLLFMAAFAVFAELDAADKWAGLAAIPAVTRASSICSIFFLKPMEGSSYEKMERKAKSQAVFVMVLMPALSLAAGPEAVAAALAAAAVTWAAILRGSKQLGGMSGDVSGYAISLGELAGALILALI